MGDMSGEPQPTSAAAADAAAGAASPSQAAAVRDLAEIRKRHQEKFLEREAENEKNEKIEQEREKLEQEELLQNQQVQDEEFARQLAKEEEESRLHQLEADEEYSRQLADQMYGGAPSGASVPMQSFSASGHSDVPLDGSDTEGQYHQMEDDEGYRPPMRTGYTDRLIDPPQAGNYAQMQWPPLLGGEEIDELLDQVRMQSFVNRRGRAQWKTVLVWALLALVFVVFTCWLLLRMQDVGGDMDSTAGKDAGAAAPAVAADISASSTRSKSDFKSDVVS